MKFQLEIDGQTVELNQEELLIHDAQTEASKASSAIFYWGSVGAAIRQKLEAARADYRHLRANSIIEALAAEPKLAEWKVSAAFEATEAFRHAKSVIEHWQRLYDQAQAIYQACLSKASMIQTIFKHETGGQSFAGAIGDEKETKKDKLRKIMRKKQ